MCEAWITLLHLVSFQLSGCEKKKHDKNPFGDSDRFSDQGLTLIGGTVSLAQNVRCILSLIYAKVCAAVLRVQHLCILLRRIRYVVLRKKIICIIYVYVLFSRRKIQVLEIVFGI